MFLSVTMFKSNNCVNFRQSGSKTCCVSVFVSLAGERQMHRGWPSLSGNCVKPGRTGTPLWPCQMAKCVSREGG